MRRTTSCCGAALLLLACTGVTAHPEEPAASCSFAAVMARLSPSSTDRGSCASVGDAQLESLRGGYDSGGALKVSFGFERVTYINNTLVARTAFHLPDVANVSPDQAAQVSAAVGRLQVIQNGTGNTFQEQTYPTVTAGTVIQNTLNDQTIRQLTSLSAATNSLQFLRGLNALATLQEAITSTVSPR